MCIGSTACVMAEGFVAGIPFEPLLFMVVLTAKHMLVQQVLYGTLWSAQTGQTYRGRWQERWKRHRLVDARFASLAPAPDHAAPERGNRRAIPRLLNRTAPLLCKARR